MGACSLCRRGGGRCPAAFVGVVKAVLCVCVCLWHTLYLVFVKLFQSVSRREFVLKETCTCFLLSKQPHTCAAARLVPWCQHTCRFRGAVPCVVTRNPVRGAVCLAGLSGEARGLSGHMCAGKRLRCVGGERRLHASAGALVVGRVLVVVSCCYCAVGLRCSVFWCAAASEACAGPACCIKEAGTSHCLSPRGSAALCPVCMRLPCCASHAVSSVSVWS